MNHKRISDAIRRSIAMLMGLGMVWAAYPVAAEQGPDDRAALAGLESTQSVFLIKKETAAETGRYLKGILATHKGLAKQGIAPKTVLVFLGKPVQYITTEPKESIATEDHVALASIAETAKELTALGARMEVCGAATKHFGVDNETLLPGMDAVGNGFISLIGWQSKGYVPMTF